MELKDTKDAFFMNRALLLARRAEGHTRPNPPVGAVIVCNGKIIGEGWHRRAGSDHAEVAAIKNARKRCKSAFNSLMPKSTLYVTLEPCSRPGRVGACTDAIAECKISRVVYACADPNPKNRGRAQRILKGKQIACEKINAHSDVAKECAQLIRPFTKHVLTGLPYVTVKMAISLDGRICDDKGQARWISADKSRKLTGKLRERVDAIMVGAETVRRDNPSLLSHARQNDDLLRVVISRSGKLPRSAQIFCDGKNETVVFSNAKDALKELGKRGIMHVLCEGGMKLATSLVEDNLVDEWLCVVSPVVIGSKPITKAARGKITNSCLVKPDAFLNASFKP
jgi:diaminohydroxyphosphoribosylaminopyrimidine deaminase/5-amino-6-(5-phosphoribosylamino)uracil reductase